MRRERAYAVLATLTLVVAGSILLHGMALAASGDTQFAYTIDTFEDGDESIDRPEWVGWTDPSLIFSTTTTDPLNGSVSGLYQPRTGDDTQPVRAERQGGETTQNGSIVVDVDGEQNVRANHTITWSDGAANLLSVEYRERPNDITPGNVYFIYETGEAKIGEWDEGAAVDADVIRVDFDFAADTATVYFNGTAFGSFPLINDASGWDTLTVNSEIPSKVADSDTQVRIDNVGVNVTVADPIVDNATGSPTGKIADREQTLSVDVNDTDFAKFHDDSVDVEFFIEGNSVGSDTLTSNGTASTTATFPTAGEQNWSVKATDTFNGSTVSQNFTVTAPENLTIRDENNPSELVNNTRVKLIFYFDNEPVRIETRNTTDGTINMAGLPANRPFVVATQTENWTDRRVYIEDLYAQQQVYLVNTTAAADNDIVQPTFDLTDFSGLFPGEETVLFVQTSINETWTTVEADFFGADGEMTATLQKNERHRLVVKNVVSGEQQIHNALFPTDSRRHSLTISADAIDVAKPSASVDIDPDVTTLTQGNATIAALFQSGTATLDTYNLTIWANDSGSRSVINQLSGTQASGERLSEVVNLTGRQNETIEVRAVLVTEDNRSRVVWRNYSVAANYTSATLLDSLQSVPGRLSGSASGVTMFLATMAAALAAAAVNRQFPASTELLGVVMVGVLGVAYLINWVPPTYFSVVAVAWVVAAGLRRGL